MNDILKYLILLLGYLCNLGHGLELLVSGYNTNMTLLSLTPEYELAHTTHWKVDLNMSWLQIQPTMCTFCYEIFAIHEVSEYGGVRGGAMSRWTFDKGQLNRQEWVSVGVGPAHLLVDMGQNMSYSANYADGSWDAVGMEGGRLVKTSYKEQFGKGCRNQTSHPHNTVSLGSFVWVVDLGCDAIYHYKMSDSGLTKMSVTHVGDGRGPRHMKIIPERSLAVVACELENFVQLYHLDLKTSNLTLLQELSIVSWNNNTGAEILVHPNNHEWIYVSSRGVGSVSVFHLGKDRDILTKVQEVRLHGTWPRSMSLSPCGQVLAVADQMGDSVQVLGVSKFNGILVSTIDNKDIILRTPHQPSFVKFLDF